MWAASRAWRGQEQFLVAVMTALAAISAVAICSGGWIAYVRGPGDRWNDARRRLTEPVVLGPHSSTDPDILHIIVDGMGRPDVLESVYGLDPNEFDRLGAAGLHTAPDALANYSHTYQAVASMLNMRYLEPLTAPLSLVHDRRPLVQLVRESAVVRSLKARGYEFVLVGSGFDVTPRHPLADACVGCGPTFPGLFTTAMLSVTPFRALGLWDVLFDAQRAREDASLDYLLHLSPSGARPRLLIAHLLIPHPPFLLGPDGPRPNPARAFEILDEALYRGSRADYLEGYGAQARFTLRQLAMIVAHARDTAHRPLVVIVNGDHGPGLRFDPHHLDADGIRERMTLLLASSWPDGQSHAELRSPVNIYRTILDTFFNAGLPLLPDRAFIAQAEWPYQFRELTGDKALSPRAAGVTAHGQASRP